MENRPLDAVFDNAGELVQLTLPNIVEQAQKATEEILPQKSRPRYEAVYIKFMDWRRENNVNSFSENVLIAYFGHLSETFKPSSLWALYSMLRSVLNVKNDINIAMYPKLKAFLKRQSTGYKSKKSKIFAPYEVDKFLKEAPDSVYLFMKVILIVGICGACRKQELKNMKLSDVEDTGSILHIRIPDTKTYIPRSFVIPEKFYATCKQYLEIRKKIGGLNLEQFFLNYQRGKWTKQVVGINKIGQTPRKIAEFLKLDNPVLYTGHSFRRTSATILVDAGGDLMSLKRHGGWKSSATAEGYIDDSLSNKTLTANKITGAIGSNELTTTSLSNNYSKSTHSKTITSQTATFSSAVEIMEIGTEMIEQANQSVLLQASEIASSTLPEVSSTPMDAISNTIPTNCKDQPIIIQNCSNFNITYNIKK